MTPRACSWRSSKKIDQIRPVTVRGVSAVLDLYCEDWFKLGWEPDNAIAALREIVAREALL